MVAEKKREQWSQSLANAYSTLHLRRLLQRLKYWTAPIFEAERYLPAAGDILDVGCGDGNFCRFIKGLCPERKVTGIDISAERIEHARRYNASDDVIYSTASLSEIHDYERFHAIAIIHVLYLIPFEQQEEILVQCKKLLRKNGKLIILSLDIKNPFNKNILPLMFHFIRIISLITQRIGSYVGLSHQALAGSRPGKPYYCTKDEQVRMGTEAGLHLEFEDVYRRWPFPYFILSFKKAR